MAALGEATRAMFMDRLAAHVAKVFPDRAALMDSPEALPLLERLVAKGKGYGLGTERALTLYVDLVFGLGEGFEEKLEHRWIKLILTDEQQTATGKMYLIYRDLRSTGGTSNGQH
jgi:hypothetical protein